MKNFTLHQEAIDYLKAARLLAGKFDPRVLSGMPLPAGAPRRVKVVVAPMAWLKMQLLIQHFTSEVGWQGVCCRDPEADDRFLLEDVMVYPQRVTGANITTDEIKHGAWLDRFPTETLRKIRFHGHSHVNMDTFSSATDDDLQRDLTNMLQPGDFYLFFIMNKPGKLFIRLYDNKFGVMYETADVDVYIGDETFQAEPFLKSAQEMVVQTYQTTTSGGGRTSYPGSYTPPASTAGTAGKTASPTTGASQKKWANDLYDEDPYGDRYDADDEPYGCYDEAGRWVSCAGRGI